MGYSRDGCFYLLHHARDCAIVIAIIIGRVKSTSSRFFIHGRVISSNAKIRKADDKFFLATRFLNAEKSVVFSNKKILEFSFMLIFSYQ